LTGAHSERGEMQLMIAPLFALVMIATYYFEVHRGLVTLAATAVIVDRLVSMYHAPNYLLQCYSCVISPGTVANVIRSRSHARYLFGLIVPWTSYPANASQ
jgi:hypothetical protein